MSCTALRIKLQHVKLGEFTSFGTPYKKNKARHSNLSFVYDTARLYSVSGSHKNTHMELHAIELD